MTDARERGLRAWLEERSRAWRDVAARLDRLDGGTASADDVYAAFDDYRAVARDLAAARRELPGARSTRALEQVYARLHALLGREWSDPRDALARYFREDLPDAFRRARRHVLWVALLFVLAAGAGAWLVWTYPELGGLFLDEGTIDAVEAGHLWTDGLLNVTPSSLLSIEILANNIAVTLFAFTFGLLFGLGTFYLIGLNGLMLGAVFAFTGHHGLAGDLGRFVLAHGPVELSVICIAGGAGAYVGESLIRPGGRTRGTALREATREMLPLLVACAVLLVGCGFIEGYVSPDPHMPIASRVAIGACWWVVMAGVLAGIGRRDAPLLERGAPAAAPGG